MSSYNLGSVGRLLGFVLYAHALHGAAAAPAPIDQVGVDTANRPRVTETPSVRPPWTRYSKDKQAYAVFERYLHPHLVDRLRKPIMETRTQRYVTRVGQQFRLAGQATPLAFHAASTIDIGAPNPESALLVSVVDLRQSPEFRTRLLRELKIRPRRVYLNVTLTTSLTKDETASAQQQRPLVQQTQKLLVIAADRRHRRVRAWTREGERWVKLWDRDPRTLDGSSPEQLLQKVPDRRGPLYFGGQLRADLESVSINDRWLLTLGSTSQIGGQLSARAARESYQNWLASQPQRAEVQRQPIPVDNAMLSSARVSIRPEAAISYREELLRAQQVLERNKRLARQAEEAAAAELARAVAEVEEALEEARSALEQHLNQPRYGVPGVGACGCFPDQSSCSRCCVAGATAKAVGIQALNMACHLSSDLCPWCHLGCAISTAILWGAASTESGLCFVNCAVEMPSQCPISPAGVALLTTSFDLNPEGPREEEEQNLRATIEELEVLLAELRRQQEE